MNTTMFRKCCRLADTIDTAKWLSTVADFNFSSYKVIVYMAHIVGHFLLDCLPHQNRLTEEAGWTHTACSDRQSSVAISLNRLHNMTFYDQWECSRRKLISGGFSYAFFVTDVYCLYSCMTHCDRNVSVNSNITTHDILSMCTCWFEVLILLSAWRWNIQCYTHSDTTCVASVLFVIKSLALFTVCPRRQIN